MENEFPPNSHTRREPAAKRTVEKAPERREVARVTTNKVLRRKKPLRKRFAEAFTGDGNEGVFEYVVLGVLVPGIKDIAADTATTAIERALFGDTSAPRRRGGSRGGYTSYSGMSAGRREPRSRGREPDREERPRTRRGARGPSSHEELIVGTRAEANEILDSLFELISKYEVATMRDLLSLAGEPHTNTDEDWGWYDLRGARAHKIREGYLIDVPRPEPLD